MQHIVQYIVHCIIAIIKHSLYISDGITAGGETKRGRDDKCLPLPPGKSRCSHF